VISRWESKKTHRRKCSCDNFTLVINKIQWNLPTAELQGHNFFLCMKVPFHPGTWILDPRNCKTFLAKTIFRYPQVPFKTGFAVFISIFIRKCTLMPALSCLLLTGALRVKTYVLSFTLRTECSDQTGFWQAKLFARFRKNVWWCVPKEGQ
jgi:prepilin signal peptidase PulO-like enzyme (type II secretory pathway)